MAASAAVLDGLPVGSRVLAPNVAYAGVRTLLGERVASGALEVEFVDQTDTEATIAALDGAALLWAESPNNPLLQITDIAALATAAHERGIPLAVDATLATPLLQDYIGLGADFVVHSATKYIAGHSDSLLGVVAVPDSEAAERLIERRVHTGAVPGTFRAFPRCPRNQDPRGQDRASVRERGGAGASGCGTTRRSRASATPASRTTRAMSSPSAR